MPERLRKLFGLADHRRRHQPETRRAGFESLESRRVLASSAGAIAHLAGDSNLDGAFDQRDLVEVFQVGKYETGQVANWSEGDWNGDERFDSADFVLTMKLGTYGTSTPTSLNAEQEDQPNENDLDAGTSIVDHMRSRLRQNLDAIKESLENGGMPESLENEAARQLLEAIANGDRDTIKQTWDLLRANHDEPDADDESHRAAWRERIEQWKTNHGAHEERMQERIIAMREALADALNKGLDEASLAAVNEALDSGDLAAAVKIIRRAHVDQQRESQAERREQSTQRLVENRIKAIESAIESERIDSVVGEQLIDALNANDVDAFRDLWRNLRTQKQPDPQEPGDEPDAPKLPPSLQGRLDEIQTAIVEGSIPEDIGGQLIAALGARDLKAFHEIWRGLRQDEVDESPEEPVEGPTETDLPRGIQMQIDAIRARIAAGRIPTDVAERMIRAIESRGMQANR